MTDALPFILAALSIGLCLGLIAAFGIIAFAKWTDRKNSEFTGDQI